MLAMFVWVFLTLIYPNAGGFLADRAIKSEPGKEQMSQITELWEKFKGEKEKYKERVVPKHGVNGSKYSVHGSSSSWSSGFPNDEFLFYCLFEATAVNGTYEPESAVDALKQYYQHAESMRISAADQTWQIRKQALNSSYGRKQRLAMNILRVSPTAIYDNVSASLAGTDLGGIRGFMDQAREYRRNLIQYMNDEKAFSSEQWFRFGDWKTENRPDLSGVPVFYQRDESVASSLSRGVTDMLILVILNVMFFILSHTFFVREEVR